MDQFIDGMVARSVSKNELRSTPKAVEAMLHEWKRLDGKAWSTSKVREWSDVRAEAYKLGKKVHIVRVFGICVEKNAELSDPKQRKFKGRCVLEGSSVKDESAQWAAFQDLGSSLSTMEASGFVDA